MPKPPVSTHPRACASICSFMFTDLGIVHGKERSRKKHREALKQESMFLYPPPSKGGYCAGIS